MVGLGNIGGLLVCAWKIFYSVTTTICMTTFLLSWGGSVWYVTIPGCQRSDIFIATMALSPYGFFTRHSACPYCRYIWRVHYPSSARSIPTNDLVTLLVPSLSPPTFVSSRGSLNLRGGKTGIWKRETSDIRLSTYYCRLPILNTVVPTKVRVRR